MTGNDTYLMHYGVKGQKWGVRRYQNEDGSLTSEGKQHYSIGSALSERVKRGGERIVNAVKSAVTKKKDSFVRRHKPVSMMSDAELRENLDRVNKERQYKQIVDELNGKNKQRKSFDQKHPILKQVFVATAVSTAASLVSKQLGVKADEVLASKRMKRAKEKGMLDQDLFPFVYNTSSRISSYNKNKETKAKAAKEAWEGISKGLSSTPVKEIVTPTPSSPSFSTVQKVLKNRRSISL